VGVGGVLSEQLGADRNFDRLYRRHVGDVYRYASAVLANRSDAEDVTQTTFLNAYRAMSSGQQPEKPLNWLITIAHNVCRQRFRQQARRPSEVTLDYDIGAELVDEEHPRTDDLLNALSLLAFNQRAALVMRELEGRSYAEIAKALDVSTSAVETLLFRARRALREQLEGAIACDEAERAISLQLDGMLGRRERGALRAHLRACPECASLARSQRAQRTSLKSLIGLPIPQSLLGLPGLTAGAGGLLLKAAAVTVSGIVISGAGYEAATHAPALRLATSHAAPLRQATASSGTAKVATPLKVAFVSHHSTVAPPWRVSTPAHSRGRHLALGRTRHVVVSSVGATVTAPRASHQSGSSTHTSRGKSGTHSASTAHAKVKKNAATSTSSPPGQTKTTQTKTTQTSSHAPPQHPTPKKPAVSLPLIVTVTAPSVLPEPLAGSGTHGRRPH
jgi:RNA polymerase sigma factor (sigma-70 family)